MILRSVYAAPLVAGLSLLASAPAFGMSCDEIMNMLDHNVPTSVVVDTIASSGSVFSAADIACLQQRGAAPEVVAKAQQMRRVDPQPEPARAATPAQERERRFEEERALGEDILSGSDDDGDALGGVGEIERYIADFKAKKYRTASYGFYDLLQKRAYPEKESTLHYYLAKSLEALDMPFSAQHYYMEVVKKGPRNPLFKHALPRIARIAADTGNTYELSRIVGKIAPESYPRQARPQLYYLMGQKAYRAGELSEAAANFERVPANDPLYPRAQYFLGIINHDRDKLKSAARAFREVIKAEVPVDNPALVREIEDLKDLSLINIARIYYGLERFDNADKYYQKVDRESAYWPQSLFERAWTQFFLRDLNGALGLLMTADSPFFSNSDFIPDTKYLKALIYFELCEYAEVERIIKQFQAQHQPIRTEMKNFVTALQEQGENKLFDRAFDQYFGPNASPNSAIPVAAFRKMLRNRDLYGMIRSLELMQKEIDSVADQVPQWRDTVGRALVDQLERDRQRYKNRAGQLFAQEMLETYRTLDELLQDSQVLLFEVASAQMNDYMWRSANPMPEEIDRKPIDFATSPDIIYWPFNGEFWLDELAYYRFTEHGSCK